jgi:succinate dehydrogenase / fumarate reductase cytochrome b subunit
MTAASTTTKRADPAFLRARLASLLAVAPLGVWTVVHLWHNLSAFQGAEAWERDVTEHPHRLAFFVTALVALLPLGLHTVWGLGRLATTRPNLVRYRYFENLKYVLQRLSAIGVLLFLGAHVYEAMIRPRALEGHPETFEDIAHHMRTHPPTLVVYVLGVLGVTYHLANGLHTFAMGWGLASSRRALRKLEIGSAIVFVLLLAMGWGAVYALWDAGAQG